MTLTVIREDVSMIKKQLIQTIPESKKYIAGNVIFQWLALVSYMIALYCKKNHHNKYNKGSINKNGLCAECQELAEYAGLRSDKCPFMETKTFCANCKVHCYNQEMRGKIKAVMRFSGPRMMFHHPVAAIHHIVSTMREKRRLRKESEY